MARYGYARVSTTEQDLAIQQEALEKAGCTLIRSEKISGSTLRFRVELQNLLDFIREGDTLVVTRLDRLARSLLDLQRIVHTLKEKGATLEATEQSIDTSSSSGRAFLNMLGVFAEFETDLRKERQAEGIAKAKAAGKYKGRKSSLDNEQVKDIYGRVLAGESKSRIAQDYQISRTTLYKYIEPMREAEKVVESTGRD
jgi:DNA invertase Pin-like site-specific DNA recombinase